MVIVLCMLIVSVPCGRVLEHRLCVYNVCVV